MVQSFADMRWDLLEVIIIIIIFFFYKLIATALIRTW